MNNFFSLVCLASSCAGMAGLSFVLVWYAQKERHATWRKIKQNLRISKGDVFPGKGKSFTDNVLSFLQQQTRRVALSSSKTGTQQKISHKKAHRFSVLITQAGFSDRITYQGLLRTRKIFCFTGCVCGGIIGTVFTFELGFMLGGLGVVGGWSIPLWVLTQEREKRKAGLEKHLSEMLEVITLGLRSGLSFDQSFSLYHQHFPTRLGYESASAQQQWRLGLKTREEALRAMVASYDSALFTRVIENIIRSLRFGSALADSLEVLSSESRTLYKASQEEKVAKASVKMLIPTATLILPAMLILVLGPIVLGMMRGF